MSPELEDTVATYVAIFALCFVPIVLIVLFWMVHVLPEKIAHKRHHPQLEAIKTLCLLSLVFGGLLWPIAWLWAYTKPVGYKLAYGTDKSPDYFKEHGLPEPDSPTADMRQRVAALEGRGVPASELDAIRTDLAATRGAAGRERHPERGGADGSHSARHLRVLRLADLHQVQAAALDHAVEGRRRDLPGRGPGDDDAPAEHLRADDHRCQGRQVRRAHRVAGEGTGDRSTRSKTTGR